MKNKILNYFECGHSWEETRIYAKTLGIDKTVDSIRKWAKSKPKIKQKVVGIFSDTHLPFDHKDYLDFVIDTFKRYKVTDIVFCGDMFDNHAISSHQTSPNAMGAIDEEKLARERLQLYIKAFQKLKYCLGNHCRIPIRRISELGLHSGYLKSFKDFWGLPKTWEMADRFIIDQVLYTHIGLGGKDGAYNFAINERMSCVVGHNHTFGGVKYHFNGNNTIFGMNVGCGIDAEAYAFEYAKYNKTKGTLGCGIVFSSERAIFEPMI